MTRYSAPELFQLDGDKVPREVAGCPPDGFSGILFRVPFQKLADEVCSLIDEKLRGISTERKTIGIEIEFTKMEGGLEK